MRDKQIVFDIDGTLIDTEYAVLHSLQETLKTLCGESLPPEKLNFALGITGEDALKRFPIKDISSALDLWNKNMCKYSQTVTVTSKTREEYENDFAPHKIHQYFSTVICADDTAEHKPMPAPLLKYMKLAGASHNETLYVGDSKYDGMCAGKAEIDFALAVWGSHTQSIRADYYLAKPLDLVKVVSE